MKAIGQSHQLNALKPTSGREVYSVEKTSPPRGNYSPLHVYEFQTWDNRKQMSNGDRDNSLVKLENRHLEGALKLSQEFSWPYRLEDWAFAMRIGEGMVLECDGEVLGTALWWRYGNHYATAGMIIVTAKA